MLENSKKINKTLKRKFIYEAITSIGFSVGLIFYGIYMANIEKNRPYVFAISFFSYIMGTYLLLYWSAFPKEFEKDITNDLAKKKESVDFYLIFVPTMYFASFIVLTNSMWQIWRDKVFISASSNYLSWILYGFDNVIRAIFLDFAETFYLDISHIEHTNYFLSCLLIFCYRTTLSLSLLSLIVRSWKYIKLSGVLK